MGSYFTTQEIKMKLFIAALATVNASVVCPTGWTAGTDATTADDCSPDDVTVTCNSDSMSVKFPSMPSTTRDPSSSVPINSTPPWPMLLAPLIAAVSTSLTTRPLLTSPSLTA